MIYGRTRAAQANPQTGRQASKRYLAWTSEQALALIADHTREFEGWIIDAMQSLGVATADEILDNICSKIEAPAHDLRVRQLSRENFILRRRTRVYAAYVNDLIEIVDENGDSYAGNLARRFRPAPWDVARSEFERRRLAKRRKAWAADVRRVVG